MKTKIKKGTATEQQTAETETQSIPHPICAESALCLLKSRLTLMKLALNGSEGGAFQIDTDGSKLWEIADLFTISLKELETSFEAMRDELRTTKKHLEQAHLLVKIDPGFARKAKH